MRKLINLSAICNSSKSKITIKTDEIDNDLLIISIDGIQERYSYEFSYGSSYDTIKLTPEGMIISKIKDYIGGMYIHKNGRSSDSITNGSECTRITTLDLYNNERSVYHILSVDGVVIQKKNDWRSLKLSWTVHYSGAIYSVHEYLMFESNTVGNLEKGDKIELSGYDYAKNFLGASFEVTETRISDGLDDDVIVGIMKSGKLEETQEIIFKKNKDGIYALVKLRNQLCIIESLN